MKVKNISIKGVVILLSCVLLFGDILVSYIIFQFHCASAGNNIFEKMELDSKYFESYDKDDFGSKVDFLMILDDKVIINETEFKKDYELIFDKASFISSYGPIYERKTHIIRREDGVILGEAVDFTRGGGWLSRAISTSIFNTSSTSECNGAKGYKADHVGLIKDIFSKRMGEI